MARRRIFEDHVLSNLENQRRVQDRAASIDAELDEARAGIDWAFRLEAEKTLA